jgi:hypothetical protein
VNIVERCELPPGFCMATLTSQDTKGFIDTGNTPAAVDPRVYISVTWVQQMASEMGMVNGEELNQAKTKIKELEHQLKEADKLLEANEYTLTHLKAKKATKGKS